jgi:alkyl sulfatase BDS1-like metallo-beta-lactamase superfamily hydrolase
MHDADPVTCAASGAIAHPALVAHSAGYAPRVHQVNDRVWCAVGYGLSNVTLVRGDEGAILIDSGECREEMAEVLEAFGPLLDRPVVAFICSHSHYLGGTAEVIARWGPGVEIWAHESLGEVMAEVGAEFGPAYRRRLRIQFGFDLPADGPDAMPNFGLGPVLFRRGPSTYGFVPPNRSVARDQPLEACIAGLRVRFDGRFAADSRDTLIIDFPDLRTVVNNHVWPVLFNVYPLRGEAYRDPQVVIAAIDAIRDARPEWLVGVHGLPVLGARDVQACLADHRDALQYLWDQTVRGINAGLGPDDLAATISLPPRLSDSRWVPTFYGEPAYHVRAIHNGLFGWFGGDCSTLHPVTPDRRAELLVAGLGGREAVLAQVRQAIARGEPGWAAELCSHLLRLDAGDAQAAALKAAVLRTMAQRTPAANTRAFMLEEARRLETGRAGRRPDSPPPSRALVMQAPPERFVRAMGARLDPQAAADVDRVFRLRQTDADHVCGLHVMRGVARFLAASAFASADARVDVALACDRATWALLLSGRQSLAAALAAGGAVIEAGDPTALRAFFTLFDGLTLGG